MSPKINWLSLKNDYIYGPGGSVLAFLKENNIKYSGYTSRIVKGWKKERDNYLKELETITRSKTIDEVSETETQIRTRQAVAAKKLQDMGMEVLDKLEPGTVQEARKMVVDGLREEREAIGLNKKGQTTVNVANFPIMQTRYAQELENMDYDQLMKVLGRLKELENSYITTIS